MRSATTSIAVSQSVSTSRPSRRTSGARSRSGEAFARQLSEAGADVEVVTAAGVPHGHLNAVGSPLTSRSLDRFAARLARAA